MDAEWQRLTAELTSLRRGRGLTIQRLSQSTVLLPYLGNVTLLDAFEKLRVLIEALGSGEQPTALKVAYGLGELAGDTLMDRRTALSDASGRDQKTLARYENKYIQELATRLIAETSSRSDGQEVLVVGYLKGMHLYRVVVNVSAGVEADGNQRENVVEYRNKSNFESLPALLYQLPSGWNPERLTLVVVVDETWPSTGQIWATPAKNFLDLMFTSFGQRVVLTSGQAVMQISKPQSGITYCLFWKLTPSAT